MKRRIQSHVIYPDHEESSPLLSDHVNLLPIVVLQADGARSVHGPSLGRAGTKLPQASMDGGFVSTPVRFDDLLPDRVPVEPEVLVRTALAKAIGAIEVPLGEGGLERFLLALPPMPVQGLIELLRLSCEFDPHENATLAFYRPALYPTTSNALHLPFLNQ